ncbi:MAG: class I SAM-dependent methyltransferase [Planctomycetota bacterium]
MTQTAHSLGQTIGRVDPDCSPDLRFVEWSEVEELVRSIVEPGMRFLDVGGRHGEFAHLAEGCAYVSLEIDEDARAEGTIIGDITSCPQIDSASFDVVFSNNVFEHVREPWRAADECVRICKPGGLLVHAAPFAWRYHPVPVDMFRYTHEGLRYLFERCEVGKVGRCETVFAGYDIERRRRDHRGGKIGTLDVPPIDELGGWREHWRAVYVGRVRGA